jgi:hypothetical protein
MTGSLAGQRQMLQSKLSSAEPPASSAEEDAEAILFDGGDARFER